eukprot:scaffold53455_cov41-Cyclotella_meneghiniana.AAC.4
MLVRNPGWTFLDQQQRVLQLPCRATDNYSFRLFAKGMTGRLGTKSNPTMALLFRHVAYMEKTFVANYSSATSFDTKRCWALAGTANLALWLGWLRSSKCFSLTWADVSLVLPDKGPIPAIFLPVLVWSFSDYPNRLSLITLVPPMSALPSLLYPASPLAHHGYTASPVFSLALRSLCTWTCHSSVTPMAGPGLLHFFAPSLFTLASINCKRAATLTFNLLWVMAILSLTNSGLSICIAVVPALTLVADESTMASPSAKLPNPKSTNMDVGV